jgi:CDP-glycerol glycerophosphotransferase (TagB/SpsB family)
VATNSVDVTAWRRLYEYSKARDGCVFLDAEADATGADIEQIMVAADVLITDFSSAAEEFLIFDRPLIFANHLSQSQYHQARGEWDEIHSCGEVVTEKTNLQRAVDQALTAPQKNASARQKMRDYVFHQLDGNAAQRAAQALCELCEGEV